MNGRNVKDKHFSLRHFYLPIFPNEAHPDSGIQLRLEDERQPRKDSYVNIERRYRVKPSLLDPYDRNGYIYRLDERSYKLLVQQLQDIDHIGPQEYAELASNPYGRTLPKKSLPRSVSIVRNPVYSTLSSSTPLPPSP